MISSVMRRPLSRVRKKLGERDWPSLPVRERLKSPPERVKLPSYTVSPSGWVRV